MKKVFSIKKIFVFIAVSAAILLLIFLNSRGWLELPKTISYRIISPVLKVFYSMDKKVVAGVKTFFSVKDLIKENSRLTRENQELWRDNSSLKEAARENEILRQRLSLASLTAQKVILADIVGLDNQNGQYFLIDKGATDGLVLGLPVVTAANFLVGRISEVSSQFSKVILILDGNLTTNAITQDGRVAGLVKGSRGLGLTMEMIPQDAKISEGETILTSGLNDAFPHGLIIGQVSRVIMKENDIFQKAEVKPAVDFNGLEKVFIIFK